MAIMCFINMLMWGDDKFVLLWHIKWVIYFLTTDMLYNRDVNLKGQGYGLRFWVISIIIICIGNVHTKKIIFLMRLMLDWTKRKQRQVNLKIVLGCLGQDNVIK